MFRVLENINLWTITGIPQGIFAEWVLYLSLFIVFVVFFLVSFKMISDILSVFKPGFLTKMVWTLTPLLIVFATVFWGELHSRRGIQETFKGNYKEWIVDSHLDATNVASISQIVSRLHYNLEA